MAVLDGSADKQTQRRTAKGKLHDALQAALLKPMKLEPPRLVVLLQVTQPRIISAWCSTCILQKVAWHLQ